MEKDQQVKKNEFPPEEDNQALAPDAEDTMRESEVEDTGEPVEPTPDELLSLLEDARAKADEHWGQVVRSKAEVDNLRKRQERELENAHKYALERFVQELLPVKDSMELGLQAAMDESADVVKLREGTELMLKMMSSALDKFNVVEVDPDGEPFDPELHQAMSIQERNDVAPNTVVTVVQKGYTLNGRLVRPAMVMVSKTPAGNIDQQA